MAVEAKSETARPRLTHKVRHTVSTYDRRYRKAVYTKVAPHAGEGPFRLLNACAPGAPHRTFAQPDDCPTAPDRRIVIEARVRVQ